MQPTSVWRFYTIDENDNDKTVGFRTCAAPDLTGLYTQMKATGFTNGITQYGYINKEGKGFCNRKNNVDLPYRIWKASINEYRIQDTRTMVTEVLTNFTLMDCIFKVDIAGYNNAARNNFVNSGRKDDYFAWIEAKQVINDELDQPYGKLVFYNPYKDKYFRDRHTGEKVEAASVVVIRGNELSYKPKF